MIKEKWLSSVRFTTVQTHVDLSAVRENNGDFNIAELSRAVNTPQTNNITARAWLEKAGTIYKGHQSTYGAKADALYRDAEVYTGILCRYSPRDRNDKHIPKIWNRC